MSEEKKKSREGIDKEEKRGQISRREFLKDAGLVVGGATIGSMAIVSACQGGGAETTKTVTQTVTKTTTVSAGGGTATVTVTAPPVTKVVESTTPGLVTLNVNGGSHVLKVKDTWTLLFVLRDRLGLFAAKQACDQGECGACTVIVDGRAVYACMMLAIEAGGKNILTLEGLSFGMKLSPVQQAFYDLNGYQCGFCTPGVVMAAKALLDKKPKPTYDEVREALSGHMCVCGNWGNVISAVLGAQQYKMTG